MSQYCPYCWRDQPSRSPGGYRENPFCRWCLHERMERAASAVGVAVKVKQEVIDKLRELRHLMENATEADRLKLPEMSLWFDTYLAQASAPERLALRQAARRMWPAAKLVLIQEAESEDLEIAAGAKLALEKMRSLREGGEN